MAEPQVLPYVTEGDYARAAGAPRQVLWPSGTLEGPPPLMFPRPPADFYDDEPLRLDFPAVTHAVLRDIVVRGRSNMLTAADAILRHDLVDPETDLPAEAFYGRLRPAAGDAAAEWEPFDPFNVDYLPEAAAFTDPASFNYAHWMTETLPRIAAFMQVRGAAHVPLVVDGDLHPNMLRSIAMAAGPQAPVYRLAPNRLVRVGRLHSISPTGYAPFKLRPGATRRATHGVFAPGPLRDTVQRLRRAAGAEPSAAGGPRLLVRRSADLRRIVNQADIDDALLARGFEVIDPGAMSLDEQVRAYSAASMVVGGTGAAITNLIFAPPRCPTIVMMPKLPVTAHWYWRRIAAAAGAGPVLHVIGDLTEPLLDPLDPQAAHRDFRITVEDVLDAVAAGEALGG